MPPELDRDELLALIRDHAEHASHHSYPGLDVGVSQKDQREGILYHARRIIELAALLPEDDRKAAMFSEYPGM